MGNGHAILSPSAAKRWMACRAAPALCRDLPEEETSQYAAEGLRAHEAAEAVLKGKYAEAADVPGLPEEDHAYVQMYVDIVAALAVGASYADYEVAVDASETIGVEGMTGTADALIVKDGVLHVVDLKFGRGVEVEAVDNPQLKLYALGALEIVQMLGYEVSTVCMIIMQPRLSEYAKSWSCSVDGLLDFAIEVRAAASEAMAYYNSGIAPASAYAPSDEACRWCRGKAICPALQAQVAQGVEDLRASFPDLVTPVEVVPTTNISQAEQIAKLLPQLDLMEQWIDATRIRAKAMLMAGEEIPGYKLVLGRAGNRAWHSDYEAERILKSMRLLQEDMYTRKVISPTAAEKLLADSPRRWSRLTHLVVRKAPEAVVVPESDKRATYVPPAVEFEKLPELTDVSAGASNNISAEELV